MLIAAPPAAAPFARPQSLTGPAPVQPVFTLNDPAAQGGDMPAPNAPPENGEEDSAEAEIGGTEGLLLPDPFPVPPPVAPKTVSLENAGAATPTDDGTVVAFATAAKMQDLPVDDGVAMASAITKEMQDVSAEAGGPVAEVPDLAGDLSVVDLPDTAAPPTEFPDIAPVPTPPARSDPVMAEKAAEPARQQAEAAIHASLESLQTADAEDGGRLQIFLHRDGDDWRVTVSADNPETLDLMRRHADQLQQDLARQGFEGAQIDFSEWEGGEERGTPPSGQGSAPSAQSAHYIHTPRTPTTGLDLRL